MTAPKSERPEKISANELLNLSSSRKLVLLGALGTGKTSLLNYWAEKIAAQQGQELGIQPEKNWLPIIIKIPDLARYSEMTILDYLRDLLKNIMQLKDLPDGFFEYWLEYGRAIILLDSLDEIPSVKKRSQIADDIEAFFHVYPKNRAIITSRSAGYRGDFFDTHDYTIYEIQPFDKQKIELFIEQWHQEDFLACQESEKRQNHLKKVLSKSPALQLLAPNPLLLTIIAFIHRSQSFQLPQRRGQLYDMAIETLLTSWESYKKGITVTNEREETKIAFFRYIDWEDARRLMEKIAYLIHSQNSAETEKIKTLIEKDTLIDCLSKEIEILKAIPPLQAKGEAKKFLQYIHERTGLFHEVNQALYGFVHLTFQEYLCAQEINYQEEEEGFEIVEEQLKKYLYNPHWQEVLLLLFLEQTSQQAAKFLQAILKQSSDDNNWRYHQLLFAGRCLSEDPKNLHLAKDKELSTHILQELVSLEVSKDPSVDTNTKCKVREIICRLKETAFQSKALEIIEQHSQQIDAERLHEYREALAATENSSPDN